MTRYAPFRKLLRVLVAWSVAYGGVAAFTAAFLKVQIGMSDGYILLLSSAAYLGGVSSLWLLESRFDRVGSKPVLNVAVLAWMGVLLGWLLVAGGVLPASLGIVLVLQFLMGLLAALVNLANNKLAMGVVPAMGRNHFFAIYSVVANVTLGLSPIVWGLLIDVIGGRSPVWLGLRWNRYAFFFGGAALAFGVMLAIVQRLDEPKAASLESLLREILIQSPQRFWLRFWPRG